jgi:hypothetical protein
MLTGLNVVVEGFPDQEAAKKICSHLGVEMGDILGKKGKGFIDKYLINFNKSANSLPWLVIRDLDHDADCPPVLKKKLLPSPKRKMSFCIAVREVEAWLMADSMKFAKFIGVSESLIPTNPEMLDDPKQKVIQLVKKSRKSDIKKDMIPRRGSLRDEGPAYASRLGEFAAAHWRPDVAAEKCESLRYCIRKLRGLKKLI